MHNIVKKWWRSIDQQLIITIFILICISVILVTTTSAVVANRIGLPDNYFSSRQVGYSAMAITLFILLTALNRKWLKRIAIIGFVINLLLLILVKKFGCEVKGATRWLKILGFSYQPSEFIKPFFAVVVGWVLSLKNHEYPDFPGMQICLFIYSMVAVLLIIQPDFGMLVLISAIFTTQMLIGGMPLIWLITGLFLATIGVIVAYSFLPHVTQRINNFLDPTISENYQVTKSLLAFKQGGIYGKGPGEGLVKAHLPDAHTDFIFAAAGEEFGAIICLIIISLFAFIVWRVLLKIQNERDRFVQIASVGLITQFGLQAAINMGVSLNLLPTKGMTLPLISYGGCSTLAISIVLGLVLGLNKQQTIWDKYRLNPSQSN